MATQAAAPSSEGSLLQAIDMVAKEKGIDRSRLTKTIEEARRLKKNFFRATRKILVELTRSLTLSAFVKNGSCNFD